MMHILIVGNPMDGFSYFGPFESVEDAIEYGEKNFAEDEWWVSELNKEVYDDAENDNHST
jgi:hypothetical protein